MTSHRGEYNRKRKKKRVKMVFTFLLLLLGVVAFSLLHVKRSPCNPTLVRTEWVWGKEKEELLERKLPSNIVVVSGLE